MKVTIAQVKEVAKKALINHGASDWIADSVSTAVADSEANGNIICGLYYLESYCTQLTSGRVNGTVDPEISTPKNAAVLADAKFGFAQPAFDRGFETAIKTAQENGIASFAVAHSHTCTSVGFFTSQFARRGLICLGMTNASSIVAPPGGNSKVLGTNPIAFSAPDNAGGLALHFDFSTSAVALGKITMAKAAGESIPLGWAVDKDGQPTTDPNAALAGSLASAADYKGWGLGLMVELLAAGMTGSVNSMDVAGLKLPEGAPHDLGQFYVVIDPSTYSDAFFDRLSRVAEAVASQPGARIPGQDKQASERFDVKSEIWEACNALGNS